MRLILAFLMLTSLNLFAQEFDSSVELKGGFMKLSETPNTPSDSARYTELVAAYKNLSMTVTNSPLYKYAELGYEGEYGWSGSVYSYFDSATNGGRLQYKYHDKSSSWSPFIGISAQHSSVTYAGDQPLSNYGGTLGLVYSEYKEHTFKLTCFREFRHTPVASTELAYAYEGETYFGEVKVNVTFGNPERGEKTKRYAGGSFRSGMNIKKRYAAYIYSDLIHYADFLVYTQKNFGIGVRASF